MHHAPPVSYPVGRPHLVGVAALTVVFAGMAAMTFWALRHEGVLRHLALLGSIGLGAWTLRQWLRTAQGTLEWDGWVWRWPSGDAVPGQLTVHLDFQHLLLLRWQAANVPAAWLWLERSRCPGRWADLRRAVYSRANPDALPHSGPPAANP